MSIETLCAEAIEVLKQIMNKFPEKNVIVMGHSLGGSIAAFITDKLTNSESNDKIVGSIIIDVVEGTALEALPLMNKILDERPKSFDSLEQAIKWSLNSTTLRKLESAKVSMPAQFV